MSVGDGGLAHGVVLVAGGGPAKGVSFSIVSDGFVLLDVPVVEPDASGGGVPGLLVEQVLSEVCSPHVGEWLWDWVLGLNG